MKIQATDVQADFRLAYNKRWTCCLCDMQFDDEPTPEVHNLVDCISSLKYKISDLEDKVNDLQKDLDEVEYGS